jgi:hypothetical protein
MVNFILDFYWFLYFKNDKFLEIDYYYNLIIDYELTIAIP